MQSAQELIGGYLGQKISAVDSLFMTMPSGHIMVFQQCYNLDANSFFFCSLNAYYLVAQTKVAKLQQQKSVDFLLPSKQLDCIGKLISERF